MSPRLIAAFRWACATFALILLPAADYLRLQRKAAQQAKRLAELEHGLRTRDLRLEVLTAQRDAARRDLEVNRCQLGADLSELLADREEWQVVAEREKAKAERETRRADALSGVLRAVLAGVFSGGSCSLCGHELTHPLHGEKCVTRAAVEALGEYASAAGEA